MRILVAEGKAKVASLKKRLVEVGYAVDVAGDAPRRLLEK